jgi:hypothetical protein
MAASATHPAVREAETDGGEHALEVVTEPAAELHEGLKQACPADTGVEAGDGGEPVVLPAVPAPLPRSAAVPRHGSRHVRTSTH